MIGGDKNVDDFEVWLGHQKEDYRAKACSAAAKEISLGYPWKWEVCFRYFQILKQVKPGIIFCTLTHWNQFCHYQLENECQRYLSAYIDMLLEVDANSEFATVSFSTASMKHVL